jgi:hypothetical protein
MASIKQVLVTLQQDKANTAGSVQAENGIELEQHKAEE